MTSEWREFDLKPLRPACRGGHTCAAIAPGAAPASLVIFAGSDAFGVSYNELHVLDVDNAVMIAATASGTAPLARSSACAHAFRRDDGSEDVVVFGGADPLKGVAFSDVHALRCTHQPSKKRDAPLVPIAFEWRAMECSGTAPAARHAFASAVCDGQLIVAGGSDGMQPHGDVFALNYADAVWRRIETAIAPPREMLAMCALGAGTVAVCGGRSESGAIASDVVVMRTDGTVPATSAATHWSAGRVCHSVLPNADGTVVVVGGATMAPANGCSEQDANALDLVVSVEAAELRTVPRVALRTDGPAAVNFGLGHSACVSATGRQFVVAGLHPNSISATLEVYERVLPAAKTAAVAAADADA